jgi:hypothetical protein
MKKLRSLSIESFETNVVSSETDMTVALTFWIE